MASYAAAMGHYPPRRAAFAWAMFDWAAQPFFTLVTTFVFAPYFSSTLAANPVQGQELWGFATAAAGLAIGILSPILGSAADAAGRRKPWIFAFSIPYLFACWALWYAVPGNDHAVLIALSSYAIAAISIEIATVFNNAMMPTLVPPTHIGRLSSFGWAAGYVSGIVCLVIVLGFFAANPQSGLTLLGFEPAFGLDPAAHEGDRATGPFSTIWYLIFILPLVFFIRETKSTMRAGPAIAAGIRDLKNSFSHARSHGNVFIFLIANMAYKDGLVAMFAFGGIYAAGQLGWGTIEIGIFGIILIVTGTVGLSVSGPADDRFGPKIVIIVSLAALFVAGVGVVSIDRNTVFFFVEVDQPASGTLFGSWPDRLFVFWASLIGLASGPLQSSSRSMLIRLAPREHMAQFFGLFALSGKVTSFLAPLAVGLVTLLTDSQAAGMSAVLAFYAIGMILLLQVKDTPPETIQTA
ncbi:MFS transporter [Roseibium sp. RKSG952]|uniref:MFS transporter n=1 Tax=Roseibium sp. RKSG952 TaxID=2529384 RepID=UPI0012BCD6C7|nr:MFS transporter [Roseibium sp. RKSG952]MTH97170.1 MFS transporter [Roseibium sp. RKSG952]